MIKIEFDPLKSARNEEARGLPFDRVADFDWDSAIIEQDVRKPYPEQRYLAFGMIGNRLHAVLFTPIIDGVRVISFRKCNAREVRFYDQKISEAAQRR